MFNDETRDWLKINQDTHTHILAVNASFHIDICQFVACRIYAEPDRGGGGVAFGLSVDEGPR